MIKLLSVLLACLLSARMFAQGVVSRPMLEDMKTWEYTYHHFVDSITDYAHLDIDNPYPIRYTIRGDTVINDISYYKMYLEVDGQSSYYAAYREEGLKVYVCLRGKDKEDIAADFEYEGLYDPEGYEKEYDKVQEEIDYVDVGGQIYRRHKYYYLRYYYSTDVPDAVGVEGIGYWYYGLRYPIFLYPPYDCVCDYEEFASCYDKDGNVFHASDFFKEGIPASVSQPEGQPKEDDTVYDIQGRKLSDGSSSGTILTTDSPSKGLRIIRYSDGTVKKVYTR